MNRLDQKRNNQIIRKNRVRSVVTGTATRPRLSVYISNRHVNAQIIDDTTGRTLVSYTSVGKSAASQTMSQRCQVAGADIAKAAKKAKISAVVFDRNGRSYQKRLTAFAEAARENGLEF